MLTARPRVATRPVVTKAMVTKPLATKAANQRYERFFAGSGVPVRRSTRKGTVVSTSDKATNKVQETKGKAKETAGKTVGNERLEAEGVADQTKANVKQAGQKVKDAGKSLKP
jgi:uncharacterized protein YjbJ (UPF0337 family)